MRGAFVGADIQPFAFYISPSVDFALRQPEGARQLRGCFDQASPITSLSDCMTLSSLGSTLARLFVWASTATALLVPSARWPPLPRRQTDRAQITIRTGARTWSFTERQEYTLKSFIATQDPRSRLVLWSNGDLFGNTLLASYVA
jgi:hypothetical protein